jgi:hypothetical protein
MREDPALTPPSQLLIIRCGLGSIRQHSGGSLHRLDDIVIAGATAEIAFEGVANGRLVRILLPGKEGGRGQHHPRRAIATLQTVLLPERPLDGMEHPPGRKTFDGRDFVTIGLSREQRATLYPDTIQQDRAGAALAGVAPNLCAGQAEMVAKQLHEERSRLHFELPLDSIDRQRYGYVHALPFRDVAKILYSTWPALLSRQEKNWPTMVRAAG